MRSPSVRPPLPGRAIRHERRRDTQRSRAPSRSRQFSRRDDVNAPRRALAEYRVRSPYPAPVCKRPRQSPPDLTRPALEPCVTRLFSLIQGGCPSLTGETVPPALALPSSFSTSAAGPIGIKLLTRSCDGLQPDRSKRSGDLCAFVHAPPCSRTRSLHEGRKFCNLDHAASVSLGISNSNLSEDKTEYEPPAFSPPCSPPGSPSWTSDDTHHLDADRPRDEHPSTLDPTHGLTTPPVAPIDLSCTEQLSEGSSVATQSHAEAEQMTASLHRLFCSPPSLSTPAPPPLPDGQATSPLPAPSLLEAAADISSRDISLPFSPLRHPLD